MEKLDLIMIKFTPRDIKQKGALFESKTFTAGNKSKVFKLPWGKLGMSICYDLRFPNL